MGFFAGGLNTVAKSVSDGLQTELGFIEQEANVLGFSNTSIVGDVASVLVHGADFYEELYSAYTDGVVHHDYRARAAISALSWIPFQSGRRDMRARMTFATSSSVCSTTWATWRAV